MQETLCFRVSQCLNFVYLIKICVTWFFKLEKYPYLIYRYPLLHRVIGCTCVCVWSALSLKVPYVIFAFCTVENIDENSFQNNWFAVFIRLQPRLEQMMWFKRSEGEVLELAGTKEAMMPSNTTGEIFGSCRYEGETKFGRDRAMWSCWWGSRTRKAREDSPNIDLYRLKS